MPSPDDFNETTLVRVTNLGDRPLKRKYANRPYILNPGVAAAIPYHAAVSWFGDPFAADKEDERERTEERERISTLYGVYSDPWTSDIPFTLEAPLDERGLKWEYVERADGQYWHPNLPNVEITDLDGNTLPFVAVDPEGDVVTEAAVATVSEQKALHDQVQWLQQQLRNLQLEQARKTAGVEVNPEFLQDGVASGPTVAPSVTPEPTAGEPTVAGQKRGPGRPRRA